MKDIYQRITDQIVEAIEDGAAVYNMPWHRDTANLSNPTNAATGRGYRGLNIISLWMVAEAKQYSSGTWATYQQWKERGAQVRKGETSAIVFFWKNLAAVQDGAGPDGDGSRPRFVARAYNVFNADQVDGYEPPLHMPLTDEQRDAQAEAYFAAIPARIMEGDKACFIPAADSVEIPAFAHFKTPTGYYSVLAHELTHWTGAKARLDRDLGGRFGSDRYAMEELVAELGAAFVAGQLGLPSIPRTDHAPYIASWLRVLKNDSRAIFTAASKAQAAADYLGGFQTSVEEMAA